MFKRKIKFVPRTATPMLPAQVAGAMNFPKNLDLSGISVAILELGGMYNPQDINNWCSQNGVKSPPLFNVEVDGALESKSDADAEVSLDICVIADTAPGVKITVVFAPNTDQGFLDGLQECINLAPNAISISWGAPISDWTSESISNMDAVLLKAKQAGIPVFSASGDNGSKDGTNANQCDYPSASPYAISCGGTNLQISPDGSRASETVWSLAGDGSGTGGGVAANYPTPDYQSGLTGFPAGRKSPDLAGNADPNTGYIIEVDGQGAQVGGTSAVAPLYAAMACVVDAALGKKGSFDWHTAIYAHPECFYDIVAGSNGAYKAQVGYDCCTGMGVLDATAFIQALKGQSVTPVPQPPTPTPPPQKVTVWQKILDFLKGTLRKIGLSKKV